VGCWPRRSDGSALQAGPGGQIWAIRPYSALVPSSVQALVAHLRAGLAQGFGA